MAPRAPGSLGRPWCPEDRRTSIQSLVQEGIEGLLCITTSYALYNQSCTGARLAEARGRRLDRALALTGASAWHAALSDAVCQRRGLLFVIAHAYLPELFGANLITAEGKRSWECSIGCKLVDLPASNLKTNAGIAKRLELVRAAYMLSIVFFQPGHPLAVEYGIEDPEALEARVGARLELSPAELHTVWDTEAKTPGCGFGELLLVERVTGTEIEYVNFDASNFGLYQPNARYLQQLIDNRISARFHRLVDAISAEDIVDRDPIPPAEVLRGLEADSRRVKFVLGFFDTNYVRYQSEVDLTHFDIHMLTASRTIEGALGGARGARSAEQAEQDQGLRDAFLERPLSQFVAEAFKHVTGEASYEKVANTLRSILVPRMAMLGCDAEPCGQGAPGGVHECSERGSNTAAALTLSALPAEIKRALTSHLDNTLLRYLVTDMAEVVRRVSSEGTFHDNARVELNRYLQRLPAALVQAATPYMQDEVEDGGFRVPTPRAVEEYIFKTLYPHSLSTAPLSTDPNDFGEFGAALLAEHEPAHGDIHCLELRLLSGDTLMHFLEAPSDKDIFERLLDYFSDICAASHDNQWDWTIVDNLVLHFEDSLVDDPGSVDLWPAALRTWAWKGAGWGLPHHLERHSITPEEWARLEAQRLEQGRVYMEEGAGREWSALVDERQRTHSERKRQSAAQAEAAAAAAAADADDPFAIYVRGLNTETFKQFLLHQPPSTQDRIGFDPRVSGGGSTWIGSFTVPADAPLGAKLAAAKQFVLADWAAHREEWHRLPEQAARARRSGT